MRPFDVLAVFVGGGLGSLARYLTGLAFLQRVGPGFPYGTLAINLAGCFFIGIIVELAQTRAFGIGSSARLFLVVGVLGGFTTFSTFAYDAVTLSGEALSISAMLYVLASVAGGIIAAFAGIVLARIAT
ncbi:MAG TPA: fluoride efflux transporter CrcB [Candidatus Baltobacteraceae bacterium]|nr:fluoride efflux transporter CrcB [Candidatus Baltobacteraceae bacterium]